MRRGLNGAVLSLILAAAALLPMTALAQDDVESDYSVSNAPRAMTLCGFRFMVDVSRVFVRTNEKVQYSVRKAGDRRVIVELQNTRIPVYNNERFLDTQYFNSAVKLIQPESIEGGTPTVRIEIELKRDVPYKARQVDNEVWIEFPNT